MINKLVTREKSKIFINTFEEPYIQFDDFFRIKKV